MITDYRKRYCICNYCGNRERILIGHSDNIPIESHDCKLCGYGVMEVSNITFSYDATNDGVWVNA
jgi:hypothetical protein